MDNVSFQTSFRMKALKSVNINMESDCLQSLKKTVHMCSCNRLSNVGRFIKVIQDSQVVAESPSDSLLMVLRALVTTQTLCLR
jgi:hypothetical protein